MRCLKINDIKAMNKSYKDCSHAENTFKLSFHNTLMKDLCLKILLKYLNDFKIEEINAIFEKVKLHKGIFNFMIKIILIIIKITVMCIFLFVSIFRDFITSFCQIYNRSINFFFNFLYKFKIIKLCAKLLKICDIAIYCN